MAKKQGVFKDQAGNILEHIHHNNQLYVVDGDEVYKINETALNKLGLVRGCVTQQCQETSDTDIFTITRGVIDSQCNVINKVFDYSQLNTRQDIIAKAIVTKDNEGFIDISTISFDDDYIVNICVSVINDTPCDYTYNIFKSALGVYKIWISNSGATQAEITLIATKKNSTI